MNNFLSEEVLEYGKLARRALAVAGGDSLARLAEEAPEKRGSLVESAFGELGAWDLDPRSSPDDADAAAVLCRSAGFAAVAYPLAERLARPLDIDVDGLIVVDAALPAAAIGGTDLRWLAVDLTGCRSFVKPLSGELKPREDSYIVGLELDSHDQAGEHLVALGLLLPCWTLLGLLDRALELTCGYVVERQQFGKSLASFEGVQFQLTEAEVERLGLEELAKYALWSAETRRPEALDDALALRVAAVQAADIVFRIAHQLHGAIGFCDESMISWVSRASIPFRRLPFGLSATRAQLLARVDGQGLNGLFSPTV